MLHEETIEVLESYVRKSHAFQAARLRALAASVTTARLRARLMDEAAQHQLLAARDDEPN
jgi:hypothetical protein